MQRSSFFGCLLLASVVGGAAFACGGGNEGPALSPAGDDAGADVTAETPDATSDAHPLCVDGKSADGAYPKADYSLALFGTLPDLSFDGVDASGAPKTIALHDYFEPCASHSRILLLRVTASWCGTCQWDLAHTKELLDLDIGSRLELVDLVVANDDNVPATTADLASFRARVDAKVATAIDPKFQLGPVRSTRSALPLYVLVDTRTMQVLNEFDDPDREWMVMRLRQQLAQLDGLPVPPPTTTPTTDGFTRKEWDLIRAMKLEDAPPPDPTNAKADDAAAAALGAKLFADKTLSPSGTVACATCHDPTKGFADGKPQSVGVATGDRNAPAVALASHARWQFWDGRADTLWAQALGPFENDKEFASSRLFVVHALFDRYRSEYEAVFGALPTMSDARFPASGKPGDAAWGAMAEADRTAVTRAYVNAGKAIAAFERTLRLKSDRLDGYASGDLSALSSAEKGGLKVFFTAGCAQCHYGPRLTDDAFHDVRFPTGRQDGKADEGRKAGIAQLLASEFRADGPFSDAPAAAHGLTGLAAGDWALGAFKTPALRGLTLTAPYGHGGTLATLDDVLKTYSTAGLKIDDTRAAGPAEPWVTTFSPNHVDDLRPFMMVLDGAPR